MLIWALVLSVMAAISAFLGFGGIAVDLTTVMRMFFFAILALFALAVAVGMARGGRRR